MKEYIFLLRIGKAAVSAFICVHLRFIISRTYIHSALIKDKRIQEQIEKIKSDEWVMVVEGV